MVELPIHTDVLIPVLHHVAIGSGVDKCNLCRFDLDTSGCRRGARCTYAQCWSDRVEWICPVCTQMQKVECESKWQHILKYQRIGVFVVNDGRTVANFHVHYLHYIVYTHIHHHLQRVEMYISISASKCILVFTRG